jgi:hypothetical protein
VNPTRSLLLAFTVLTLAATQALAQPLPRSATPRGVVVAFLTETCSPGADIDRALFRERLAGELRDIDPAQYRATVPAGAKVRIDSIPDVLGARTRRAVAYVTVTGKEGSENSYIYLMRDSIWRIEAIRRLVPANQRGQIRAAIGSLDTSLPTFRLRKADLEHLLLPDDSLTALLRRNIESADRVVAKLRGAARWTHFALRDVDFSKVDEYRELDDDVAPGEVVFYQIDRGQLSRLKERLGIRRIERDERFPQLIFLQAAALEQSHYGYVYGPVGADLPPLSDSEFIVLRPVAAGWWLYKRIAQVPLDK